MTVKCYVTIVGSHQGNFKGGSTEAGHEGAIEGLAADYGLTRGLQSGSKGSTAGGRPQHVPMQITLASSPATPQLLQAMVTDEALKSVTVDFAHLSGAHAQVVESIVVSDARIVNFQHQLQADPAAPGDGQLLDHVAFQFHSIEISSKTGNTTATDTWQ